MPWFLRIIIVPIGWAFPRTRHGDTFSRPLTYSPQICATVIHKLGLRKKLLNLGSQVTSPRPHIHMRQSRNKNVGLSTLLIPWPTDVKSQLSGLIGKDPDAWRAWRQEEKGMTEDEMVGWHRQPNGHEFDQTLGDGDGQGSLVCCSP